MNKCLRIPSLYIFVYHVIFSVYKRLALLILRIENMSFNAKVCEAFFDFQSDLNKGHGIVSSIYALINRNRLTDESYFACLEQRIRRESAMCKTKESFIKLLLLCWKNLPENCTKWSTVALMFFITDVVDSIARIVLDELEYRHFKEDAAQALCYELDFKYRDSSTKYAWDVFNIGENTIAKRKRLLFHVPDILCVCVCLYATYQLL